MSISTTVESSIVRAYVHEQRQRLREMFVPLPLIEFAEVDFGEALAVILVKCEIRCFADGFAAWRPC